MGKKKVFMLLGNGTYMPLIAAEAGKILVKANRVTFLLTERASHRTAIYLTITCNKVDVLLVFLHSGAIIFERNHLISRGRCVVSQQL